MVLARKLRPLLYLTILLCALSIIVSSISLSGRSWFLRTAQDAENKERRVEIEYGLFTGVKLFHFEAGRGETKELAVVCEGALCMFSCGLDGQKRKDDIRNLLETHLRDDDTYCSDTPPESIAVTRTQVRNDDDATFEEGFFNIGYWLGTIVPVAAGILFSVIGMTFALYNTQESPTQPVFGIFGLYIWNGCAAAFILLGMIVWGSCFSTGLRENGSVSETISQSNFTGNGSLGYSYWILILSILFHFGNLGILYFHGWKLSQTERTITHVIDDKLKNGDILLF